MKIEINKDSMVPIYKQVADIIRDDVYNGSLAKGEKLPSEQTFAEKIGISRGTMRKAISVLIDDGTLVQIQGKGTFVNSQEVEFPLNEQLFSFAEMLERENLDYKTTVVKKETRKADQLISKKLDIEASNLFLYLERIRSINAENLMLIENRINIQNYPELIDVDYNNVSLFRKIEELTHHKISYAKSTYEAVAVGKQRGELLDVPEATPILKMTQSVYLDNDDPIEYGTVWLKGNKYFLTTTAQRRMS
ncbi:GntR family transcriptional regulator [Bombilactobacillus folatiphilus]|uniref:GntR family transcriptional regulator n=1 Tax=Bombilactobacillus folatiphilus TaxID=2923362 RepID=A0ABY4P966_9LACO|nr:GntR family transcriptional regulator [Bombilactobacillus folatiphilus]UQS82273.1 GntR family transcriptional regulator [Bombilactobacillus folatiphilus]